MPLYDSRFNHILCSILLLCVMSFINYFGITISKIFTNIIGIMLLCILGFIILVFIPNIRLDNSYNLSTEPISYNHFVLATILSLFLYNGYDALIKLKEEAVHHDDVYKSIIITIIISTVIFILLVMISVSKFGYKESGNTYHLLVNLYEHFFNHHIGQYISYIIGILIMFNTAFIALISSSRFLYHCAKHNEILFSKYIGEVNIHKSPFISIIISFILCIILIFSNNEVMSAIFTNFSVLIILNLICISIIIIRWKERDDIEKQKNNEIGGNINNIPVILVITSLVLFYFKYMIIRSGFYYKHIHLFNM